MIHVPYQLIRVQTCHEIIDQEAFLFFVISAHNHHIIILNPSDY